MRPSAGGGAASGYRRPGGADAAEEEAAEDALLRPFDTLSISQQRPASSYAGGARNGNGLGRSSAAAALSTKRGKLALYAMGGAGAVITLALVITLSVQAVVAAGGSRTASAGSAAWVCPRGAVPAGQPDTVTLFVIGDWGRQGTASQKKVAKMMSTVADCMPPALIISTGDNFYSHGLRSSSDWQIAKSFTDVYDSPQLAQVPWMAVLGNHDYGDGIDPEANSDCAATSLAACPADCCYSPVWQSTGRISDARWHLRNGTWLVPSPARGLLDVVMLDTNPFITRYRDEAWWNNAGGLAAQQPQVSKARLHSLLAASSATWKLVVGHHPISSFGQHCHYRMAGDCEQMSWLEGELESAGVAAYLCGHDHDLQHNTKLSDPSNSDSAPRWPHHIVSGAGSDTRSGEKAKYKGKDGYFMEYMTDDSGFVAIQVNATHLAAYFYGGSHAEPAHTIILPARTPPRQPPQAAPAAAAAPKQPTPRIGMAVQRQQQAVAGSAAATMAPRARQQPAAAAAAVAGAAAVVPQQPAQVEVAAVVPSPAHEPAIAQQQLPAVAVVPLVALVPAGSND